MATLTYNPNEADSPEFTEQEQADIQLGDKLQQAEEQSKAEKYQAAKDLENQQIELTSDEQEQPDAEDPEQPEEEEEDEQEEEESDSDVEFGFTEEDVVALQNIAGGKEAYEEMLEWAADNVPAHEVKMFNEVMDLESPQAAFFAIHALRYAYRNATGYEGQMLQGKAAKETVDVFRSQAELIRAMDDPRYEKDPAYRSDVEAKLSRSKLDF